MGSDAQANRKLFIRAIYAADFHLKGLKRQLQDCTGESERKKLKKEVAWWRKEILKAKERLKNGSFESPLNEQIAKSRADRLEAVKRYQKQRERQTEAEREEREQKAREAHREAVKKAREEGKTAPPPPRRRNGKKVSALNFLVR